MYPIHPLLDLQVRGSEFVNIADLPLGILRVVWLSDAVIISSEGFLGTRRFFLSSLKMTSCCGVLPVFLSYKCSLLQKSNLPSASHLSVSKQHFQMTWFVGKSLDFFEGKTEPFGDNLRKPRFPILPIRAASVKRRKEIQFDNVIEREKKLKLVLKIRKLLMSQPNRIMALRELGRYRKALGLDKKRRFIALLKKFPAVFEVVEEGAYSLKFKLTPEAERLYLEEMQARNAMEDLLVIKLRKLLMMSLDKRILLEKIAHLKTDFGLPLEFRDTICVRYPQYFKVVQTERGPALELTDWDPELAVSVAEVEDEERRQREREERNLIINRLPKFDRVKLPKGLNLSKGDMRRICQFRDMPYISPYSNFSMYNSGTPEKEKHACSVVHEILSLTVEKRTLIDNLTHFREEFRFSQQLRGMLIRHPDMFYVSLKGKRNCVVNRGAFGERISHNGSRDIYKHFSNIRILWFKEDGIGELKRDGCSTGWSDSASIERSKRHNENILVLFFQQDLAIRVQEWTL
ncbi:unnamed protein product [Cuscuta epithymum]|uniref:PORR domain-containing protein n=1 Tax=Cuscuta epithymum TaxID=186058 RepID=A0AAV0F098_9ASTE|nr:unnamed protein product [Cuscuta epithymum]